MGRFIVKLDSYYLEWSTIVDAPVTWGMSLSAFQDYYLHEYGNSGMKELPARLKRIEESGLSSAIGSFGIRFNRAGKDEAQLTRNEIIKWYCVRKEDPRYEEVDDG